MKKITLLVASIFLVGSMANASENPVFSDNTTDSKFDFDEPISFTERGIEFFIFPNGQFDFNTRPDDSNGNDYYYKTAGKREAVVYKRNPVNYGVRIDHDSFGRVRRIGNTFINYDFNDRVNRIGTVYMKYNNFALAQVGGLRIKYNRRGEIIDIFGSVKGYRSGYQYQNSNWNHNNYDYNSQNQNDDDYYYYKQDGTKSKIKNNDNSDYQKQQDSVKTKR